MRRTTAAILIAIMIVISLAVPILAQGYQFLCTVHATPDGNWSMNCVPFVPTPVATVQPTATATVPPPTATSLPATPTATATMIHEHPTPQPTATAPVSPLPTPQPTATAPISPLPTPPPQPTTNPGPIAMYPGAPKCSPDAHDPMAFHTIWNAEIGCYYDHEHGDDPALADDIFGSIARYTGGGLMLPWHQAFEHDPAAHGGWKFEVNRTLPAAGCRTGDCIIATRTLTHNGPKGAYRSTHTFLAQYLIQSPNGTRSIITTGGAWVMPALRSPYVEMTIPNDGMSLGPLNEYQVLPGVGYNKREPGSSDPYRNHSNCTEVGHSLAFGEPQNKARERIDATNTINRFWIMDDDAPGGDGAHLYGMNPWVAVATTVLDGTSCVVGDSSGLQAEPWLYEIAPAQCPRLSNGALGCRFNNSFRMLFSATVEMGWRTAWLDNSAVDRDKRIGWLDIDTYIKPQLRNADGSLIIGRPDPRRFLTEAATCTAYSADCAPLVFKGRTIYSHWETPFGNGSWTARNYDNPYSGVWWLGPGN